jgi:hypothetical protein
MEEKDKKVLFLKNLKSKLSGDNYKGLKATVEINEGFKPIFMILRYPNSILNPSSYMAQKNVLHHLSKNIDKAINEYFPDLILIMNEHLIPKTNEEKLADEKRERAVEEKRLKKIKDDEIKSFNDNHGSIFSFKSSKSLYPNFVEFKPTSTTLNILKKYIHDDSISELEEYFQLSPEEYFNIKIQNGSVNHFESENLNIGFMYTMNLLNNKMYVVKPFAIPKPLINLLITGSIKHSVRPATSDPLIRQKLKKLPLRILEQNKTPFCNFIFRHIEKIITFNPYFEKDLDFHLTNKLFRDKNQEQVTKALNRYLSENNMFLSDLFNVDTSTNDGMKLTELYRKQLILIFTLLISKYLKLYYENNIDMSEYTKSDNAKSEGESNTLQEDKPKDSNIMKQKI